MIFVPLGTQPTGFNRCLKMLDEMIEHYHITEEIVVQAGNSVYESPNFKTIPFIPEESFKQHISDASVVISHAGSGALFNAIKQHKKLIAVARLKKYHEMADDHQTELVKKLAAEGYILDGTHSLIDAWARLSDFIPRENDFQNSLVQELENTINQWLNEE